MSQEKDIINEVKTWLEDVVIGLNLCPFAAKPYNNDQIRFNISSATTKTNLLLDLQDELTFLDKAINKKIETTIIIIPKMLSVFDDYNQFLELVDQLLIEYEWEGVFQIASFHPDYCFADTSPSSKENYTNRSPYPLLHILRESSVEKAINAISTPDEIFKQNIMTIKNISEDKFKDLFGFLKLD